VTLRDRLPAVAAVLAAGEIDMRLVNTIVERTVNVTDELIGRVDAALAGLAGGWGWFSKGKIIDFVDAVVAEIDPDGGTSRLRWRAGQTHSLGAPCRIDGAIRRRGRAQARPAPTARRSLKTVAFYSLWSVTPWLDCARSS